MTYGINAPINQTHSSLQAISSKSAREERVRLIAAKKAAKYGQLPITNSAPQTIARRPGIKRPNILPSTKQPSKKRKVSDDSVSPSQLEPVPGMSRASAASSEGTGHVRPPSHERERDIEVPHTLILSLPSASRDGPAPARKRPSRPPGTTIQALESPSQWLQKPEAYTKEYVNAGIMLEYNKYFNKMLDVLNEVDRIRAKRKKKEQDG